ncbi:hypothetical protein [Mycobacteroides abscessus]|uniref:hypothetical protein n=1 Tax=Mycobacteroides abscessus TaxID=36809 RepID=UPI000C259744|nr:hypothetical protein [Mycobacteroides abscessus]RIR09410.1 hypothetical protein D2E27_19400 [Mycobacteroides abscessus]RIS08437.1 hypothetical protein D2E58_03000 [Mycobacteroides abscessus]
MDSKFSPWLTVKDHYATLVDKNDPEQGAYWPDYVVLIGIPTLIGIATGSLFTLRDVAAFIAGVAIFTALLFGLVIYVFQLRMQLLNDPHVPRDGKLVGFIDQLFANVNYAVVIGMFTTTAGVAAAMTAGDNGRINHWWSGILTGFSLHLMLVVFMCIKRTRAAYREVKQLPRSAHI